MNNSKLGYTMNPALMLLTLATVYALTFINWRTVIETYRVHGARITIRRGAVSIGGILVVFITVLIGAVLAGPFETQLTANLANYTGGAGAIGAQIPLFYILLLVVVIVAPVAREFAKLD